MAITAADVALWAKLAEMGHVPSGASVIEIGQANWHGDELHPVGPGEEEKSFRLARAFWHATFPGLARLDAIDLNGLSDAIAHDLNTPIPAELRGRYDVLVNTGTLEHVFDQCTAWRNCHDLVRPGGLMVHGLPWTGWINHGFVNYQPGLVLDLAEANGYELLLLWCTTFNPLTIRPVFKEDGDGHLILEPTQNTMLHVAYRKGPSQPFRVPAQSGYDEIGGDWRSVPGWLTPAEGRALQELARGKRVLELGAWKGRSTCCLAEVAEHVVSVDTFQGDEDTGKAPTFDEWRANVTAQKHWDRVTPATCTFAYFGRHYIHHPLALALVDGEHSEAGTEEACRIAIAHAAPGGTVAVHDWHRPSVRAGAARCGLLAPLGVVGTLAWFRRPPDLSSVAVRPAIEGFGRGDAP